MKEFIVRLQNSEGTRYSLHRITDNDDWSYMSTDVPSEESVFWTPFIQELQCSRASKWVDVNYSITEWYRNGRLSNLQYFAPSDATPETHPEYFI